MYFDPKVKVRVKVNTLFDMHFVCIKAIELIFTDPWTIAQLTVQHQITKKYKAAVRTFGLADTVGTKRVPCHLPIAWFSSLRTYLTLKLPGGGPNGPTFRNIGYGSHMKKKLWYLECM